MPRARNLKPGFFKNEDLAECSAWARLCFAGLWTLADREGRLEDRPKRIKGELFAFDSFDVEPLLCELEKRSFIVRYEIDGERFIQVSKFLTHQTPHYSEKPSVIKPPPLQESRRKDDADSKSAPRVERPLRGGHNPLNPESRILIPDSPNPDGGIPPEPPARKRAAAAPDPLPGWVDATAWDGYEAMRRAARKPMTPAARRLAVAELAKLRDAGHDPTDVLRQSTFRSWVGLFPLKAEAMNGHVGAMSEHGVQTMRNAQALEARLFGTKEPKEVSDGS